mmetsp:Transcript_27409/g.60888  ORF Transcript_27409/g.60888 Transcript_27409/m.60888 type:complete len:434 (+) Transcript_27409:265-1566(+)
MSTAAMESPSSRRTRIPAVSYATTLVDRVRSLFPRTTATKSSQQQHQRTSKRRHDEQNSSSVSSSAHDPGQHVDKRRRNYQEFGGWFGISTTAHRTSSPHSKPRYNSVTEYLRTVPSVMERIQQLYSHAPVVLSSQTTNARIINVLQGEVAHATPCQADILVSDHATTCHILAARSVTSKSSGDVPSTDNNVLASLCHIDQPCYEECIRNMIQLHKSYHSSVKKGGAPTKSSGKITIELHLVGGFKDSKKSSISLTEHLMGVFGRLAREERDTVDFVFETCAVSCLNDNGSPGPIGRGLAIDIASGEVYLAKADESVSGPAVALRNCRLWAGASTDKLTVIHTPYSDCIVVDPFDFCFDEDCEWFNSLSDEKMLLETSTSPDVEEDDYCDQIRLALKYMLENDSEEVFGPCCRTPVQYVRSAKNKHQWCLTNQ